MQSQHFPADVESRSCHVHDFVHINETTGHRNRVILCPHLDTVYGTVSLASLASLATWLNKTLGVQCLPPRTIITHLQCECFHLTCPETEREKQKKSGYQQNKNDPKSIQKVEKKKKAQPQKLTQNQPQTHKANLVVLPSNTFLASSNLCLNK